MASVNKQALPPMPKLLNTLTKRRLLTVDDESVLESMCIQSSDIANDHSDDGDDDEVNDNAKSFALTLYYYSREGYEYVRTNYNTCLPHVDVLKTWYKHTGGVPGFTEESFQYIEKKVQNSGKKIYCSLILSQIEDYYSSDQYVDGEGYFGFENVGSEIDTDCQNKASTALVFSVSAINETWYLPIGYFLLYFSTGDKITRLIEIAIYLLEKTGVSVISLSLDTYRRIPKELGCNIIDDAQNLKTTFEINQNKICVFPHCGNLHEEISVQLQATKEFKDGDGNSIAWTYISELKKNASNTKLKNNPLDREVSAMLTHFKEELKSPTFCGADGTIKFINYFNDLMDMLNSTAGGAGLKEAVNEANKKEVVEKLNAIHNYFSGIKTPNNYFIKICVLAESAKEIIKYLDSPDLESIPFHNVTSRSAEKLIEKYAGKTNVTAYKLYKGYKKYLKSELGN